MKMSYLLVALVAVILVAGCSQSPPATDNTPNPPASTVAPSTPTSQAASTVAPTTVVPAESYSLEDCGLLTIKDIADVMGVEIQDGQTFKYPGGTCSRGWGDKELFRSGRGASISLNMNKIGTVESVTGDLAAGCRESFTIGTTVIKNPIGMENIETVTGLGDYDACWYKQPYDAVNFGKGKYKFQLQCTGGGCSKDKAVALAKLVVGRVS